MYAHVRTTPVAESAGPISVLVYFTVGGNDLFVSASRSAEGEVALRHGTVGGDGYLRDLGPTFGDIDPSTGSYSLGLVGEFQNVKDGPITVTIKGVHVAAGVFAKTHAGGSVDPLVMEGSRLLIFDDAENASVCAATAGEPDEAAS
jgi:hypothetical protein